MQRSCASVLSLVLLLVAFSLCIVSLSTSCWRVGSARPPDHYQFGLWRECWNKQCGALCFTSNISYAIRPCPLSAMFQAMRGVSCGAALVLCTAVLLAVALTCRPVYSNGRTLLHTGIGLTATACILMTILICTIQQMKFKKATPTTQEIYSFGWSYWTAVASAGVMFVAMTTLIYESHSVGREEAIKEAGFQRLRLG